MHNRPRGTFILMAGIAACMVLHTTCGHADPAAAATPAGITGLPPFPQLKSVADLDSQLQLMNKAIWTLHGANRQQLDGARSPASLADQWLLTQDTVRQLDLLRAAAEKQEGDADAAGLSHTLDQAHAVLKVESMRLVALMRYAQWWASTATESALIKPLLDRETPVERDLIQGILQESKSGVIADSQEAIRSGSAEAASRAFKAAGDSIALYNSNRQELAKNAHPDPATLPSFSTRDGNHPCPPPATGTSGTSMPKLRQGASPLDYPQDLRYLGIEGTVMIKISVSETGCVTQAQVVQSSGVPELDHAALTWVQAAGFLPAERHHHAVSFKASLPITYRLN